MKQNLFRVIINEDKKRRLNVWVDNAGITAVDIVED